MPRDRKSPRDEPFQCDEPDKKALDVERLKGCAEHLDTVELDELFWFLERKGQTKTQENLYIMTMVSRSPKQIVGHLVSLDKSAETIKKFLHGNICLAAVIVIHLLIGGYSIKTIYSVFHDDFHPPLIL